MLMRDNTIDVNIIMTYVVRMGETVEVEHFKDVFKTIYRVQWNKQYHHPEIVTLGGGLVAHGIVHVIRHLLEADKLRFQVIPRHKMEGAGIDE